MFLPKLRNNSFLCKFCDLCCWKGEINRATYLMSGLVLFAIKHNLDRDIYYIFYGKIGWKLFDYLYPFMHIGQRELTQVDTHFFLTIFFVAIPFIYIGVGLTIQRLRALKLPLELSIFFFIPILNFLFFLILSVLPPRESRSNLSPGGKNLIKRILDYIIPDSSLGSAIMAVLIATTAALGGVLISVSVFERYGFSLFVAGPVALGLITALIYGYHGPKTLGSCIGVASLSIFILSTILIIFAVEGFICVLMALPIEIAMAAFGAFVGYFIQRRPNSKNDILTIIPFLILGVPLLMGAEYAIDPKPAVFAVRSFVDVDASAETVWKNVVSFPRLSEPHDILFKAGVAYPIYAEIKGHGVGAIRECHFSTGAFVEPITIWDENHLLKFDVVSQPTTMKELSPYNIHPPHLNNYLVSQQGQFLLTKLPNGKIRLEGTTWYYNKMWPESYWKIWSDHIIHKIHLRVLNHIKNISEAS